MIKQLIGKVLKYMWWKFFTCQIWVGIYLVMINYVNNVYSTNLINPKDINTDIKNIIPYKHDLLALSSFPMRLNNNGCNPNVPIANNASQNQSSSILYKFII